MSAPKRRKWFVPGLSLPRLRTLSGGGLAKNALPRLVRLLSGAGTPAGREIPSRREAGAGLVLYALLVPFGLWALGSRDFVTGSLLTAIGAVGVAGIALRNLARPGAPGDGRSDGGPT